MQWSQVNLTGLFQPKTLTSRTKIQNALTKFTAALNRENHVRLLQDLFGKPYIIELVLSSISKEAALSDWILEGFPLEPTTFENSFTHDLLVELANFFHQYSSSVDENMGSTLLRYHSTVHGSIENLLTVTFLEGDRQQDDIGRTAFFASKNVKTKGFNKEKTKRRSAFEERSSIGRDFQPRVPKTRAEADKMCKELLIELREILIGFLRIIRNTEVAEFIKSKILPTVWSEEPAIMTLSHTPTTEALWPAAGIQSSHGFPTILSLKVAFHFDIPDDFGKWRIFLASRAQADLRDLRRRSKKIYDIAMINLKELSHGCFSANNQRRLTGSSTDIPIFEADLLDSQEHRIVYSVDCVTDFDNHSEVQALRIFGVSTLGQIDHSLWKSVSSFLTSRGKEYRERCMVRNLDAENGDIYLPALFPVSVENDEVAQWSDFLPPDNENQLHHIISLEKYVALSEALLKSIDTNRDANFPYELSKRERDITVHPFSCYVLGRSGTGKTTTMLFKMLLVQRVYQMSERSQQPPRQMFVTKSRKLAEKVEEQFMTYLSSLSFASNLEEPFPSGAQNNEDNSDDENIVDEDDMRYRSDRLPKFTDLEDRHFPLFISFDDLCRMIQADISYHGPILMGSSTKGKAHCLTNVNFDRFLSAYWPRFSQSLTAHFHALPVFNEIIGVISGSEGTLNFPEGYLDRQAYSNLSSRTYPTFADHRDAIYDLFSAYLKRKRELQDFDVSERTHAIIRFIEKNPSKFQKISNLYVDEIQDNLLIDTRLLRLLCKNTDGLFWAGDTAQTISAGSSFRFNDLKAFQHRIQEKLFEKRMSNTRVKEPTMFYLPVNHRSHSGIVNCANSIIDIISRFWKDSIDALPRERGNAPGATPIFYTDLSPENMQGCHLLKFLLHHSNNVPREEIELGAHQCIIVRDKKAKEKLSSEVDPEINRNIVSLYDTKGLEYNDVVLYNFFQDSPLEANDWKLILHEVNTNLSTPVWAPLYNHMRHIALCSELKGLYVAVTRARNHLRIVDESLKGEPMRALWQSRDQVISCKPGDEPTAFAKPSSREEWAKRARIYFDNQNWLQASQCYEKALKKTAAAIADAYHQRQEARRMPVQSPERAATFVSAGKAFVRCAKDASKADRKNIYLKIGAQCYHDGGKISRAAEIYREGGWVPEAVTLFHELRRFDDVFNLLTQSNPAVVSAIPVSIYDDTRLDYLSRKYYRKVQKLFTTPEEQLQFLADHNLDDARLDLLLHLKRTKEAVKFLLSKGSTIEAIDVCLGDGKDRDSSTKRAKRIILENLWQLSSFGVTVEQKKVEILLSRSVHVNLNESEVQEVEMFRTIIGQDHSELARLASSFMNKGNLDAAALCLDHYFRNFPELIQVEQDIKKLAGELKRFSDYVEILQELAFLRHPVDDSRARQLFGFRAGEKGGTIVLLRRSLLCNHLRNQRPTIPVKKTVILRNEEFTKLFHECLQTRLLDEVMMVNDACLNAPALRAPPCVKHLLYADCDPSVCELLHIPADMTWFENWVSAHLSQIIICQSVSRIQRDSSLLMSQRRYWLIKLYEALIPSSDILGSTSTMINVTTAFPKAVSAILGCVRALSFDLQFNPRPMIVTCAMQIVDFAFTFDKEFAVSPWPPQYSNILNDNIVLKEMLMGLNLDGPNSLFMGLSFICRVVNTKIPINIHVFCTFIERISTLLIVCNQLKTILDYLDVNKAKSQQSPIRKLLRPVEQIIHTLHSTATPDIYNRAQFTIGPNFYDVKSENCVTKAIFIARLCRVLGLLACNIPVPQFRSDILSIFTSIRGASALEISPLYAGYFNAKTFDEIRTVTCQSMRGGIFDEMVKLLHKSRVTGSVREFLPVRNLIYSTHDELRSLIRRHGPIASPDSNIAASVQPEDKPAPLEQETELEQEDDPGEPEIDIGATRPVGTQLVHGQDLVSFMEVQDTNFTYGDREVQAACLIQRAYRRFNWRRRNQWFVRYQDTLQADMKLSVASGCSIRYSVVYLGPLPELRAALEVISKRLPETKKQLKERLTSASGDEQAKVNTALTIINKAKDDLKRLQEKIEPRSALHSQRSITQVTKVVQDVFTSIKTIQSLIHIPEDTQRRLDIVYKAFLQEKISPRQVRNREQGRRGRRPQLVMDDPEDLIQDARGDVEEHD